MSSVLNSSSNILSAFAQFTGYNEYINQNYNGLSITIFSDRTGFLKVNWLDNNNNLIHLDEITYTGASYFHKRFSKKAPFFRVEYLNGGITQTVFYLNTNIIEEHVDENIADISDKLGLLEITNGNLNVIDNTVNTTLGLTNSNLTQINSNIAGIKSKTDNLTFTGVNQLITTGNSYIHGWCEHHQTWEKIQVNSASDGHQKLLVIDEDVITQLGNTNSNLTEINSNIGAIKSKTDNLTFSDGNLHVDVRNQIDLSTIQNTLNSVLNELNFLRTARSQSKCFWAYNEGSTAGNLLNLTNFNPNKIYYVYNIQISLGYSATASNQSFVAVNTVYNPSMTGTTALNYYNLNLNSTTYSNVNVVSSLGAFTGVRNLTKCIARADTSYYMLDYQEELIQVNYLSAISLYINSPSTTSTNATIRWFEVDI